MSSIVSTSSSQPPSVLIIGGGPGGMAAGIWARRLGLRPHIIERGERLGGQLLTVTNPITDYPGIPQTDGPGLAARLAAHVKAMDVEVTLGCAIRSLDVPALTIELTNGQREAADGVVIASGAARRRLGLAEEGRFMGRGVYYSVSRDRHRVIGREAVIVGGGDSAVEGATFLGEICSQVHLISRGALSARPDFIRRARRSSRIRFHTGRRVVGLQGGEALAAVELDDGTELACAGLFIRIGVEPETSFLGDAELLADDRGYLVVDQHQRCIIGSSPDGSSQLASLSAPSRSAREWADSLYAIGDACAASAMAMSVSVSAGQAMIACKHIQYRWLHGR